MSYDPNNTFIIKLGGSTIVPDEIDVDFLKKFKALIEEKVKNDGYRFYIITGGGRTCRYYQEKLTEIKPDANHEELDWVGIGACNINGHLVRTMFDRTLTHHELFIEMKRVVESEAPITVVGVEAPGHSSDFDAVDVAEIINAKHIVKLSNIQYVYDSDPKKNPDAVKYEKATWDEYLTFIPSDWTPGMSTPFDPPSSRRSRDLDLEVVTISRNDIESLTNYLDGKPFAGTTIKG